MLRFIVRRLLQAVLVMFIVSVLLFAWLRSLPGGPVDSLLGERATPATRAALSKTLGLDQPLPVQYWHFLSNALHGNFGTSTQVQAGTDAMDLFLQRLPATVELSIFAIIIALATAIPLGYFAAKRHGGLLDTGSVVLSRKRAAEGLYPAIDPLQSNSRLATPGIVGARHYRIAQDVRRTLAQYAELKDIIAMLGLEQLSQADRAIVGRARRLERFLTQPFFTTEQFTGMPGRSVPLADALEGCERILRDEFRDHPESALYMIGSIAEVRSAPAAATA